MKILLLITAFLSLLGCATIPLPKEKPFLVLGIPISMDDTSWYRDYCTHAQPVDNASVPYSESCVNGGFLHHSYMYEVKLRNPMDVNRQVIKGPISFALTGGKRIDYNSSNKAKEYFILQNSPNDFFDDTGIKYMGTSVAYDKKNSCIYHSSYIHTDYQKCPDRNYHEIREGECLTIEELRKHYAE